MKSYFQRTVAGLLLCMVSMGLCGEAHAERNPYSVDVRPTLRQLLAVDASAALGAASSHWTPLREPVRFSTAIVGEGVVEISLTAARARKGSASFINHNGERVADPTNLSLLRGSVKRRQRGRSSGELRMEVQSVRGVMFERDHKRTLHVYFEGQGAGGITRYYRLAVRLNRRSGVVSEHLARAPEFALYGRLGNHRSDGVVPAMHARRKGGAATISGGVPVNSPAASGPVSIAALSADIAMQGDHTLYAALGGDANAEIASIMNTVAGIYEADLGMTFSVVDTTVLTSEGAYPASMTDSGDLLDALRISSVADNARPAADLYHLILGRDMDGDTVGLAYVGVVCSASEYSYGLSQYFNASITPPITAHELGHNFGGEHTGSGIMSAVLGDPLPSHFSSESISQISTYAGSNSDCLASTDTPPPSEETPTPTPIPSLSAPSVSLRTSASGTSFRARLTLTEIVDGCMVTLRGSTDRSTVASGDALFTVIPTSTSLLASATIRFRTRGSSKVFFIAESSCAGRETQYSAVRSVASSRLTGRRAVSTAVWLARLQALFATVSEGG